MTKPGGNPEPVLTNAYWYAWSLGYRLCLPPAAQEEETKPNPAHKGKGRKRK